MDHWHHFAYLWGDQRAAAGLVHLSPRVTEARVIPTSSAPRDRPILCVDVEALADAPNGLRHEIAGIDCTAFDAFLTENRIDGVDEWLLEEQARVRAMTWLSRQIGAPVGYWFHAGSNGLVGEYFLGFGSSASMWANHREAQGWGWDETKPRSAHTAALWHIGARVPNVDEYDSMYHAFGWPRVPIREVSDHLLCSADSEKYEQRGGRLPDFLRQHQHQQHNQPMQRTRAAGIGSFVRKLLGRGPGR